ncbi:uncharacterized protein LOC108165347 [Drosophila miranda]|uniref:uncharacterized protein LOC108165347 n=1 Tax=Drosophila miranda TaxID=7229 RepID=UPI0007E8263E|nr:uncharacterized protein LOC108165347 [Drosophila miranda]
MSRIQWLWKALKVFRFLFHSLGLLQLRFSRSRRLYTHRYNCCRYIPCIFVACILLLHQMARQRLEMENALMNSLETDSRPPTDGFSVRCEYLQSLMYLVAMIWSLIRHKSLWQLVNQSQMSYKQLKTLLGMHLILECSWQALVYGGALLLLLFLMGYKTFWLDFPLIEHAQRRILTVNDMHNIANYLMGIPRLIFVLLISLHILYHLLHAGWLQSLQNLRLDRNLKCFQLLLRMLYPLQRKLNLLAGLYFRVTYDCFVCLIAIRIVAFARLLRFDATQVLQQQKSRDDLEDEAAWNGKNLHDLTSPEQLLRESLYLLAWHLALWLLLLAAAHLQQGEYQSLIDNCWQESRIPSKERKTGMEAHVDILDIMFQSQISVFDHQRISICFLSRRIGKLTCSLTLNTALGQWKLRLNLVIGLAVVYFVQQTEIKQLQSYLWQREHE